MTSTAAPKKQLLALPADLQVNFLSFLRAYDLSAMQQTCTYYANPVLADAIVRHVSEVVYPPDLTTGFEKQPTLSATGNLYNFEQLRNMELVVIARVLARPEPKAGGFVVSKNWCKAALNWLEVKEHQRATIVKKKVSKKQQRLRNRRLSDASPPWPNVNSDIICEHENLVCLSNKSARARRRILDKQAWKLLKQLYPDSSELEARQGECFQCQVIANAAKQSAQDKLLNDRLQRKRPLNDPIIRQFYTRTRGVPTQALCNNSGASSSSSDDCPLQDGDYMVLPRLWCHGWRKYIKTGESINPPPDAACLLCDAHRQPLLPPHLEEYLYGHSPQLLLTRTEESTSLEAAAAVAAIIPGQEPDEAAVQALRAAGLDAAEVNRQLSAMRLLEQSARPMNRLDRENHAVVEIVTGEEFRALEALWPRTSVFELGFAVRNREITFLTPPCRACDATGRASHLSIKNRARGWVRKSADKARAPASLAEY